MKRDMRWEKERRKKLYVRFRQERADERHVKWIASIHPAVCLATDNCEVL